VDVDSLSRSDWNAEDVFGEPWMFLFYFFSLYM